MTEVSRDLIPLTDDEIEARFEEYGYGLCVSNLSFAPAEEIDHFRAARVGWALPGEIEYDEPGLFVVSDARATKGQAKRDIAIIVFGEVAAIYGADK